MRALHTYLLSDRTGAAYAFAGAVMGGTFGGIVTIALGLTALLEVIR